MPRAGRPVKTLVSAVWRAASLFSAARWTALVVASGQSRYAVPTCTPAAPSASAAAHARASAMPPAAITGTCTARDDLRHQRERADLRRQVVGQEHAAMAARLDALRDDRVDAAAPRASALRRPSSPTTAPSRPTRVTRASSSGAGRPKWKLTTAGLNALSTSAASRVERRARPRGSRDRAGRGRARGSRARAPRATPRRARRSARRRDGRRS